MANELKNWLEDFNTLNPVESEDQVVDEKKEYKLDLFRQVLPALDRKDKRYYGKLTPEEQASISPWLLMIWMTSVANNSDQPHYVFSVNSLVNDNFSCMSPRKTTGIKGHEELQWMLLSMCGTGRSPSRRFIPPAKGVVKNRIEEAVLKFLPNLRDHELDLFLQMNSEEELAQFFKDNGIDDKAIKEIFKSGKSRKKD